MWSFLGTFVGGLLKFIFERMAKKKLSDKEFVQYITAHQKMRGRAGDASMEWEKALDEAKKEMAEED